MLSTILNIVATALLVPVLYHLYKSMTKPRNFPPGPISTPIIGSFYRIVPEVHTKVPRLAKIYGNIIGLKLGRRNSVCITGYDLIKEVISDRAKDFPNRPKNLISQLSRGKIPFGIAAADYGPQWSTHRKFFHTAFRNMGLNKRGIQKCITDELPAIIQEFEKNCDKGTVDPSDMLEYATLNVLASFAFGNRYEYGDLRFKALLQANYDIFKRSSDLMNDLGFFAVSVIPYLHHFWMPKAAKSYFKAVGEIRNFAKSEISHHKKALDPQNPRDIIDYYLIELNKKTNENLSEEGLEATMMDLFQAGTETTSTTLRWAFLYMANHPDVQAKVHEEIDRVIGLDREPTYEDRLSMPYCEATILEVQRKATIAPIGLVHVSSCDTTIRGYNNPKGTPVISAYHTLHYSPDHWKNPEQFDPENFLDPDGTVGTRDAFMPFGGGLRICVGMALAKQELFLFFVGILQKFNILPPDGNSELCEEPVAGMTYSPKPFKIKLQRKF